MDILAPELIWIEGRCYRFCDQSAWCKGKELKAYEEETYEPDDYGSTDDDSDESIEIVQVRQDRFKHSFHVNSHFYRFIIGAKGATLKRLGTETKTVIQVPRLGQDGDVTITGANRRDITAARHRIDLLIETSRSKLESTHFIAISAVTDEIKENFRKFKEEVLRSSSQGVRGIKEEIFQKPEKFHLTIVMLVLLDEEDRRRATEALEYCKENIILPTLTENGPINIEFRGVEIMNDDPSEVKVLYIRVHDESGCLQKMCDDIVNFYVDEGFSRREYNNVKLHMTAMNTAFLIEDIQSFRGRKETFDATKILEVHKNTYFGKTTLTSFQLCQRHAKGPDGYYLTTSKIEF